MKLPDVKKEHQKPIAIFTDGFEYHKEQLDDDFQKRCGVINESDFLVWSITWSDLIEEDKPSKGFFDINEGRFKGLVDQNINPDKAHRFNGDANLWMDGNGLKTLLTYLNNPNPRHWNLLTHFISLALSNGGLVDQEHFDESIEELIENIDHEHPSWNKDFGGKEGELFTVGTKYLGNPGILKTGLLFTISKENLRPDGDGFKDSKSILKLWDSNQVIEEDKFRKFWEGILHHLNLLQFLSSVHVFTTRGIKNHRYSDWLTESTSSTIEQDYDDVLPDLKYLAEELKPFVEAIDVELLAQAEVEYELVGDRDQVLAAAELGWETKKVAILGDWQMPQKQDFVNSGWEVITIDEAVDNSSKVIEKLNQ
jgi:DEAD/DEAH box helicase domain-containing protein